MQLLRTPRLDKNRAAPTGSRLFNLRDGRRLCGGVIRSWPPGSWRCRCRGCCGGSSGCGCRRGRRVSGRSSRRGVSRGRSRRVSRCRTRSCGRRRSRSRTRSRSRGRRVSRGRPRSRRGWQRLCQLGNCEACHSQNALHEAPSVRCHSIHLLRGFIHVIFPSGYDRRDYTLSADICIGRSASSRAGICDYIYITAGRGNQKHWWHESRPATSHIPRRLSPSRIRFNYPKSVVERIGSSGRDSV